MMTSTDRSVRSCHGAYAPISPSNLAVTRFFCVDDPASLLGLACGRENAALPYPAGRNSTYVDRLVVDGRDKIGGKQPGGATTQPRRSTGRGRPRRHRGPAPRRRGTGGEEPPRG